MKKIALERCLQSLVSQSEEVFKLGRDWELIVVDDHSTDRTGEIARSFAGVTVMPAAELEKGWTGKANAIWTAARKARGRWLLFTDADTVHEPGDLRRAMHEAMRHKVGMLSYSPRQIVSGLAQRTLMPLVFSELALAYPPARCLIRTSDWPRPTGSFCWWNARRIAGSAATRRWRTRCWRMWSWRSGEAAQGRAALSLCRGCGVHADVPHHRRDDRGLDEEPGAAV